MQVAECRPCHDHSSLSLAQQHATGGGLLRPYMTARHHALTFRKALLGIDMHIVAQNMATNGHHYSAISCLGPSLVRRMCSRQERIVICACMLPRSAGTVSRHHAPSRVYQRYGVMHPHQKQPCSAYLFRRCVRCVRASGAVSTSTPMHPLAGRCMGPPKCAPLRAGVHACTCTVHPFTGITERDVIPQQAQDCSH